MSVDLGDRVEDSIIYFMWSTNAADGSSITRATNGTVSVYKNDGIAQSVAGITDTEDFDSLTGIHLCKIDLGADAFYATAEDYTVVLSGATIDGKSVNAVLAVFSIENRFMRGTDSAALAATALSNAGISEPAQGNPPTTPTPEEVLKYIYFRMMNKNTETASEHSVFNTAGTTKVIKATVSDSAGTLTKGEFVSGA